MEEGERELKGEGEMCGVLRGGGGACLFSGRGALEKQQWVVTGGVKALTPLMVGRHYEGVKPRESRMGS
jgi:hypothetical protein